MDVCEGRVPPLKQKQLNFHRLTSRENVPPREQMRSQIADLSADSMAHVQSARAVQDRDFNKEQHEQLHPRASRRFRPLSTRLSPLRTGPSLAKL